MKFKKLSVILGLLLLPFFVSANGPQILDLGFIGGDIYFNVDRACRSELSYVSSDKTISFNINDTVFRQNRNIQLWNLDFTTFNYVLKLTDNQNNVTVKEGVFTVVPADQALIDEKEEGDVLTPEKPLNEMTRDELVTFLDKIMRQLDLR